MCIARHLSTLLKEEKHMSRIRLLILCMLFELFPVIAFSQPVATKAGWLETMRLGGYVIVLRHGQTTSDQASPDPMANPAKSADPKNNDPKNADPMSNPAKKSAGERQLSEQGRAQAKSVGEGMHKLRIPVGIVMTSPLQRAIDTGTLLGFGEVTANPDLAEAGAVISPEENKRRAEVLRGLASLRPPADSNLVVVTHKPNITEAFGKDWSNIREGEATVFEPDGKGGYKLVVRIRADEWSGLLQSQH
jgi:phosphohistidine phosphatase SixA